MPSFNRQDPDRCQTPRSTDRTSAERDQSFPPSQLFGEMASAVASEPEEMTVQSLLSNRHSIVVWKLLAVPRGMDSIQ